MSFVIGLIACGSVMLVITVVGHGIWLIFAAFKQAIVGPPLLPNDDDAPRRGLSRVCPGCDEQLKPQDRDCPRCGLDRDSRLAADVQRLRDAYREVIALTQEGSLDAEAATHVATRLMNRIRSMIDLPRERPVAETPIVPDPVPVRFVATSSPPVEPEEASPVALPEEPKPLHPRGSMLASFMEEKNILWGELAGGLLIVGCSIALVLTLWRSLEALPYFPFLLSTAITVVLFAAGQYTLHHWKLAATSRGLLVIAMLLAPLNLLLLAAPGSEAAVGWLDRAVKVAAVILFVGITRAAGRDLIGTDLLPGPVDRRWLLALAVVGAPASQSIAAGDWTFLPAWLPLACHAIACGAVLGGLTWYRRRTEPETLGERQASALLMFVGISLFALFAAWGLLLARSSDVSLALNHLALPLAIAGMPILEAGRLVQRRIVAGHSALRATGTAVALAGSALLGGGIVLAWPDPLGLTLVAAVTGLFLTRIAWRDSLPRFQIGAVPALGLACVLGVHGFAGHWAIPAGHAAGDWLRHRLDSSASGIVLAGFALLLAAAAELAARFGNRPQGIGYALGAAAAGIVGLFLVNVHGPEEPWAAVGVHFACAAGALAGNFRWQRRIAAQAGVWLLLTGTLWFLRADRIIYSDTWGFAIAMEALAFAALALGFRRRGIAFGQIRTACRDASAAAGVLAAALMLFAPEFPNGPLNAATLLAIAATGLLLARLYGSLALTWTGSAFGFLGLLNLAICAMQIRPITAAVEIAILAHAMLAATLALMFRQRARYARLFGEPLRQTARIATCLGLPMLLFPASGHALEWSGLALWLAVLWFAMVWKWREIGAFSAGLATLCVAAVLAALAWAEQQAWWHGTKLGPLDPRALQAFGVGLAALVLVGVAVRRLLHANERLRELWLSDPLSVDRLVTAGIVLGQYALLAIAVTPAANAELTPIGYWPGIVAPTELSHAFTSGGWLLLGLLAMVLIASLRLRRGRPARQRRGSRRPGDSLSQRAAGSGRHVRSATGRGIGTAMGARTHICGWLVRAISP